MDGWRPRCGRARAVIVADFVLDGVGGEWRVCRDGLGVGVEPLD